MQRKFPEIINKKTDRNEKIAVAFQRITVYHVGADKQWRKPPISRKIR